MIGSVNGVGTNFYIGSQSSRAQELDTNNTKSNIDKNSLNNLSSSLVDERKSHTDTRGEPINLNETNTIKFQKNSENLTFASNFSLSGIAANGKISIWGKLMGYDKQVSQDEINDLKNFINQTKALGFGRAHEEIIGYYPTDVDLFAKEYTSKLDGNTLLGLGHKSHVEGFEILDKDLSIDEFKDKWIDYALRQYLGERVGVESITIGKKAISMLTSTNKPPVEYQTLQNINFTDEESRQRFLTLMKAGMKSGADFKEVVEGVLSLYNVQNTDKLDGNKVYASVIGRSEKLATYDINKDEKFAYLKELMQLEKNGVDILKLMEKVEQKQKLDIKV
ncbi:hypothetical protein [Campylobacter concisus]